MSVPCPVFAPMGAAIGALKSKNNLQNNLLLAIGYYPQISSDHLNNKLFCISVQEGVPECHIFHSVTSVTLSCPSHRSSLSISFSEIFLCL
jgi:hypothetical protein